MIAKVNSTSHITRAVMYGQDERKGGEVLLFQHVDMTVSPEEQAADLNAMSKPSFKVKAYNIILSFDDNDTEKIRQMEEGRRYRFEREIIKAFIAEMEKRGTNITDCPFVVARHGNTDNEHFHMTVLTTTIDGEHIHDSYIKKNAIRAAAKISEDFGLRAAPKALRNEIAHQVATGERDANVKGTRRVRNRQSNTAENIQDRIRRREAVEKAERRKAMLKRNIERIARESTAANFAEKLKSEGMTLCQLPKGWGVTVTLEEDKERTYTFAQLDVDNDMVTPLLVIPPKEKKEPSNKRKVSERKRTTPSPSGSITHAVKKAGRVLNSAGGQSGGYSREDEVSKGRYEDSDEEWRRRGGHSM